MKKFHTEKLEKILKSRFFISQSASIYGGVSGFFDLGPIFYGIYKSFCNEWRKHFVLEENLLEVDTSILLLYNVLKASGHVDRFCDIIILDEVTKESFRADHYLEEALKPLADDEQVKEILKNVDCLSCEEIDKVIKEYNIKTPKGNSFAKSSKFNLMFETFVGYKDGNPSFLRPETAQGQFLNFKKLYDYNNKKMPFGSASIGKVFRNEISPRAGLLRVREFEQAEIEFFVEKDNKTFEKFKNVKHLILPLKFKDLETKMTLDEAVSKGIIDNEILGYFIGRAYQFLIKIGIDENLFRFRQHKKDEMAHYAKDCWDAEIFTSAGWVECVGIADRSAYDLTVHSKATNTDLVYKKPLDQPILIEKWVFDIDKSEWAKLFKNKFQDFLNYVSQISSEEIEIGKASIEDEFYYPVMFENKENKVKCIKKEIKIYEESSVPDVIEPSFGIGRILYSLLEHSFYLRNDGRSVLKLTPQMSSIKCAITSLISDSKYKDEINKIRNQLVDNEMYVEIIERSCSIGKRYSSCDEIGIPFFITFDPQTVMDNKVTIRERDSADQIRVKTDEVVEIIVNLVKNRITWDSLIVEKGLSIKSDK